MVYVKLSWNEIINRARVFSKEWKDASDERAQAQLFLNDFFHVFGVPLKKVGLFERKVPMGENRDGYIDLLWRGVILVEMKSRGKSLKRAYKQAQDYAFNLADEEIPEYIMVCDFENIKLYRLSTNQEWKFKTANLDRHVRKFSLLAGYRSLHNDYTPDIPVNELAAKKMAKLHDKLRENGYDGHALEVYLIRLLYCMFADDSSVFEHGAFYEYIKNSKEDGSDLSERIAKLFSILDMNEEKRRKNKLLPDEMKRNFPYINGKLFSEVLPFAYFDSSMRDIILECCQMDWSKISPAIFGAMFQEVTDQKKRRELGAHYTSEENIKKLIDPLFLDDLRKEFELIKYDKKKLKEFHNKITSLKFLDPACGCGNFLIVAYRELRLLELDVLTMLIDNSDQISIDVVTTYCKVNVDQFYGIELEDFPCQIAQVGMWLVDHQMNMRVAEHFGLYYARLPLRASATIVHTNALRIDWNDIVPKTELNYIMGNPPFAGARLMSKNQKNDLVGVWEGHKKIGDLDYVTAWYKKAADYMRSTKIESAFVSTNSISQGLQPAILWNPLIKGNNTVINFAHRTFKWTNESKSKKAAVHCVVIGFSDYKNNKEKKIFKSQNDFEIVDNINPYLVDAPNVLIERRSTPLCNVPTIGIGNKPIDGGYYIFTENERNEFIKKEPSSQKLFRRWMGAEELLNGYRRYFLYAKSCFPSELKKMPEVLKRIKLVSNYRLNSKSIPTQRLSKYPLEFHVTNIPSSDYLAIPEITSESKKYIPMKFMDKDIIASNLLHIVHGANLYHFGVLSSSTHMAWIKTVCGRLGNGYRYSDTIVYNNFIWPNPTPKQKEDIEKAAQAVLDARNLYPNSTLADLYDPNTMPVELTKAHEKLDKAVKLAYGNKGFETEADIVASLMRMYKDAIDAEQNKKRMVS